MKKILTLLFCALAIVASAKEKGPEIFEISAVGEGVANGGKSMITITLAAKKASQITDLDFKNAAVRYVLFRGWNDNQRTTGYDTSATHPAICGNPDVETQHVDYFTDFFESGEAKSYVDLVPDTKRVLKNDKLIEVSQTVVVDVKALRKKMERDNIVKKLRRDW